MLTPTATYLQLSSGHHLQFSKWVSGLAMIFGVVVLTGWAFHIYRFKAIIAGQVAVKVNAAICFLLIGAALWLSLEPGVRRFRRLLSTVMALTASVVGFLSFLECLYGWDLGIDQLLFRAGMDDLPGSMRPGLMSPIAAADFFLLGIAIPLLDTASLLSRWLRNLFASIAAVASVFGILDFVLDPQSTHTHIAPTTALMLFLFSLALLCARAQSGLGSLLVSSSSGGELSRRLLPASILIPIAIAWLRWKGQQLGLYSEWTGVVIMTVSTGLLLSALVLWTAFVLNRIDIKRMKAEGSNRNLAAIVNASSDAIIGKTIGGIVTSWNPAAEAIYGYSAEEMIGQPATCVVPQERLDEFQRFLQRLRKGEKIHHYETERTRKDGSRIWVSLSTSPIRDEQGDIVGASTIARDITERKQAAAALDRSETRYRSLVTATSQIVWMTNAQGEVVEDMPLWRDFTGMTIAEIKGSGWLDSLHRDDRQRIAEVWREAVRLRRLYDAEYRIRRQDGEYRDFSVRGVPVLENDGSLREWVGTCTDITTRKRAEAEILALNRDLEERVEQRTAELTHVNAELTTAVKELEAFSYSVSHDLRAPLRHISGFSQILMEEFASQLSPEAGHYLKRIDQGTLRMGQLVDDLLNLSRVGRRDIALQVTGLASVVEEVVSGLKPDIGDRQVEWKIGTLPFVECDPTLIKQVFQNLLSNSLKFTRPRAHAIIEIGQRTNGKSHEIFVRDNGVGFSMKYADKLFGVFQRLHRPEDFEGTGVGLATVQRIVEKHGGRVWAEAELDKGASFYFTLGQSEKTEMQPQTIGAGARS